MLIASEPIVLNDELEIRPLAEGLFLVIHHFPSSCNSLIVRCGSHDFVWVDTPCTDDATSVVHEWLMQTFADVDPNLIEINTGFHNDNLGGNGYLLAQGVPCYGSDQTPKLIAERWEQTKQKVLPYYAQADDDIREVFINQELIAPDHLYSLAEGLTLEVGGDSIEVFFPGPTHTPDNVVVFFNNRGVLFGGCMLKALTANTLGFIGDADMTTWPASLEKVRDRFPDARLVIPGHGAADDLALIDHTIELCRQQ